MQHAGWPAAADLIASSWMVSAQRPAADAPPCPIPIERRIAAAAAAGYRGIGINLGDLDGILREHGGAGLKALMEDAGLVHLELETLTGWWDDDPDGTIWRRPLAMMLAIARDVPVLRIKVNGSFGPRPVPIEAMRRGFARIARIAGDGGTRLALEPVAFSNVTDAAAARAIVADSVEYGGGVMLDCWHFARGGLAPDALGGLTAEEISGVEISNVDAEVVGSLFEDTVDHRRLPGEGVYDVSAFLNAVAATGYTGTLGCEVLSIALREKPLEEAMRTTAEAARAISGEAALASH